MSRRKSRPSINTRNSIASRRQSRPNPELAAAAARLWRAKSRGSIVPSGTESSARTSRPSTASTYAQDTDDTFERQRKRHRRSIQRHRRKSKRKSSGSDSSTNETFKSHKVYVIKEPNNSRLEDGRQKAIAQLPVKVEEETDQSTAHYHQHVEEHHHHPDEHHHHHPDEHHHHHLEEHHHHSDEHHHHPEEHQHHPDGHHSWGSQHHHLQEHHQHGEASPDERYVSRFSQSNLIPSIGRPFNPNTLRNIDPAAPGNEFLITRRASEVKFKQLPLLGDFNRQVLSKHKKVLTIYAWVIGVLGVAFLILLICTAILNTPMEYLDYFLHHHFVCMILLILSALQPLAVAPACRYGLTNLKHIRTYYHRVPPSLVLPVAVVFLCLVLIVFMSLDHGPMHSFLEFQMMQYFNADYPTTSPSDTWDGIQSSVRFSCCGLKSYKDWKFHNLTEFPYSCCDFQSGVTHCFENETTLQRDGCRTIYLTLNVVICALFVILEVAIIVIEILSIIRMRKLWVYIRRDLYDGRTSVAIMGGKLCSLCDMKNSDAEHDDVESAENDASRKRKANNSARPKSSFFRNLFSRSTGSSMQSSQASQTTGLTSMSGSTSTRSSTMNNIAHRRSQSHPSYHHRRESRVAPWPHAERDKDMQRIFKTFGIHRKK